MSRPFTNPGCGDHFFRSILRVYSEDISVNMASANACVTSVNQKDLFQVLSSHVFDSNCLSADGEILPFS